MNLNSNNHVYQAVPPYLHNREIPATLMAQIVGELQKESPDLGDTEVWSQASARVEAENDMIWFGLRSVSMPDTDALDRSIAAFYNDRSRDKASELEAAARIELVKKHVASINNLVIDGEPVSDFDIFYQKSPKDLVRWVCDAVHSSVVLSHAERKNFMPGQLSPA